jgi:hypothetical protein
MAEQLKDENLADLALSERHLPILDPLLWRMEVQNPTLRKPATGVEKRWAS